MKLGSKVPTVRQVNWLYLIPHALVFLVLLNFWGFFYPEENVFFAAITYFVLSISLQRMVPKSHRVGMKLVKSFEFEAAIPCFERSHEFFSQYWWLDKYRFVFLLSASAMCYREMALVNVAFCYSQMGNGTLAIEHYERVLAEYPENGMAQAGLNMLEAGKEDHLKSEET